MIYNSPLASLGQLSWFSPTQLLVPPLKTVQEAEMSLSLCSPDEQHWLHYQHCFSPEATT